MSSPQTVPVLLVTANVGSIFEEPSVMLKIWTDEFLASISRISPKFIALHCQEVGGKNYEQSMRHVEEFVRLLMSSEELRLFDKVRIFLDEDFSSAEHFTALGNLYFVHETLNDVLLWDFKDCTFEPVTDKEIHSGNIEAVTTKEKAKFPQEFFPECKWSRKGFLRTRWSLSGTVFDLINIHLFHDASNFIAMETFPSVYSKTRKRALGHTLDRFHTDHYPNVPYFLFGDFNFRTDTFGVIKKLTANTHESQQSNKGNLSKLQFRNEDDDLILSLGKKEFSHHEHQQVFIENSGLWLQEFDKELEDFKDRLFEFPINFIPSYPFQENITEGTHYMKTRVPAWCDRVLLSHNTKSLVKDISSPDTVKYGVIGSNTCMGDHKPVYLNILIQQNCGILTCCGPGGPPCEPYRLQPKQLTLWPTITKMTVDNLNPHYLHANIPHAEPYTPDSMDSPSPGAATQINACEPALLKSRLESIAADDFYQNNQDNNRTSEDLSWQRAQLLTRAWLQGETQMGYKSFCGLVPRNDDTVVPRIAIVDASSLESGIARDKTTIIGTDSYKSQDIGIKLKNSKKMNERIKQNVTTKKNRCTECCKLS